MFKATTTSGLCAPILSSTKTASYDTLKAATAPSTQTPRSPFAPTCTRKKPRSNRASIALAFLLSSSTIRGTYKGVDRAILLGVVPRLRANRHTLSSWLDHNLSEGFVFDLVRRVIGKFIRRTQFLGNLAKIQVRIGRLGVDMRPACLPRNAVHDADPVFVPRVQRAALVGLGVADRVDDHVCSLRRLNRAHHIC